MRSLPVKTAKLISPDIKLKLSRQRSKFLLSQEENFEFPMWLNRRFSGRLFLIYPAVSSILQTYEN